MRIRKTDLSNPAFVKLCEALMFLLCFALTVEAQAPRTRTGGRPSEPATARHFESLRKSPLQMTAFLRQMPKGADLHSHLSGAVYAESYIQWAADKGLCVDQATTLLSAPPCDQAAGRLPVSAALTSSVLYRKLIDSWSMRNWQYTGNNGHDQFFDSFGKFGAAGSGQFGNMLAEVTSRAAKGKVLYLELMLTPDGSASSSIGQQVGWDGDFRGTLNKLKSSSIDQAATAGIKTIQDAEAEKNRLLKCDTPQADAGCSVTIRYIYQVSRGGALGAVFAQMVTGLALANDPNSKVVGLNLVQPEDSLPSMQNFTLHMEMLNFLRPLYPKAHITLHAGELAPGLVPPAGLTFHVRESVVKGQAERIGHGVSVMYEDAPYDLLKEMARRKVMVEICLTSNETILGIKKAQHPLATYLQYGVPVALATDDEGVARSEISQEYLKAAEDHGLGYSQLKTMARNSLQYAFVSGQSLWADSGRFTPVSQCRNDLPGRGPLSSACKQFLASSEKARLQWKLEEEFKRFESEY
jgi:adenosine deaminase/adenosine deaminase CECR1